MSFIKTLATATAALTIAAAPPAAPQPAPAARPVPAATTMNCLLASNFSAKIVTDPNGKALAQQTLFFYLGRVDPRITAPQLKLELKQAAESLKGVSGAPLMNACLQELRAKAQMLQSVGQEPNHGK